MIIVLIGESASGKSTIENIIANKFNFSKTVSYTTRPVREDEKDGKDYYFISEDEYYEKFNNGFFIESGAYNGWFYGTTKDQYSEDKNIVCVLTPHGMRQMKKNIHTDMKCFYIKSDRSKRLVKALERGDNVDEAIRRNQSDVGQFDGVEDEVDYVIENNYESSEKLASKIISLCEVK